MVCDVERGCRACGGYTDPMGSHSRHWRVLGVPMQVGVMALACAQADAVPEAAVDATSEVPSADNGQTGSTHGLWCTPEDGPFFCAVDLDDWRLPEGRAELTGASCTYGPFSSLFPVCECRIHRSRLEGDERPWDDRPEEAVSYLGASLGDCSERGRLPSSCLYCGHEFPGCSLDDPASCDVACADAARRIDADMQKTFSIRSRVARCAASGLECEYVTEIDGLCYARDPREKQLPVFDCALGDEQLLEHRGENFAATCQEQPVPECQTAGDCSGGLACSDGGQCVSCGGTCSDVEGRIIQCPGAPACADGELCAMFTCLPAANVGCGFPNDCQDGQDCVVSGIDRTGGRGNAATRTLCLAHNFGF
jgi:hypothetical protein